MLEKLSNSQENLIVEKLLSGTFFFTWDSTIYKVRSANAELRCLAEYLAGEASEKLKFNELITKKELAKEMDRLGIWTFDQDKRLAASEEVVEEIQVSIYKSFFNHKALENLRKRIASVRKTIDEAKTKKASLDSMTLESYSNMVRDRFTVGLCLSDLSGKKYYNPINFLKQDAFLLDRAYEAWIQEHSIFLYLREISRTQTWRNFWNTKTGDFFNVSHADLNVFQRSIVTFSKMYDSARESMEVPPDEIFADDDAFDGWMTVQRKEAEKKRGQKNADTLSGQKGDEIYMMAPNKADSEKIYDLNTHTDRMKIKGRIQQVGQLEEGKTIEEQNLTDVKRKLRREMIEQVKNRR
jgi:hypothetical protein